MHDQRPWKPVASGLGKFYYFVDVIFAWILSDNCQTTPKVRPSRLWKFSSTMHYAWQDPFFPTFSHLDHNSDGLLFVRKVVLELDPYFRVLSHLPCDKEYQIERRQFSKLPHLPLKWQHSRVSNCTVGLVGGFRQYTRFKIAVHPGKGCETALTMILTSIKQESLNTMQHWSLFQIRLLKNSGIPYR